MMSKCRAKRKDNGEWVCGESVFQTEMMVRILPSEHIVCMYGIGDNIKDIDVEDGCYFYGVDPATLSRCSGLTACGQEVYEGDIIRFHHDGTEEWWTAVLRFGWHDHGGEYGWYLVPIRDTAFTKRIGAWFEENALSGVTAAVIGNVWDDVQARRWLHLRDCRRREKEDGSD